MSYMQKPVVSDNRLFCFQNNVEIPTCASQYRNIGSLPLGSPAFVQVSIIYVAEEIEGSSSEALRVAQQDEAGIWQALVRFPIGCYCAQPIGPAAGSAGRVASLANSG
jgi:hypothetical protein